MKFEQRDNRLRLGYRPHKKNLHDPPKHCGPITEGVSLIQRQRMTPS